MNIHIIQPFCPEIFTTYGNRAAKLLWIFPGAPLNFNGAPGNIQGNLRQLWGNWLTSVLIHNALLWPMQKYIKFSISSFTITKHIENLHHNAQSCYIIVLQWNISQMRQVIFCKLYCFPRYSIPSSHVSMLGNKLVDHSVHTVNSMRPSDAYMHQ